MLEVFCQPSIFDHEVCTVWNFGKCLVNAQAFDWFMLLLVVVDNVVVAAAAVSVVCC